MLAKGFDSAPPSESWAPFALFDSLAANGSGILTLPRPALRRAICVVNLLSMAIRKGFVCSVGRGSQYAQMQGWFVWLAGKASGKPRKDQNFRVVRRRLTFKA